MSLKPKLIASLLLSVISAVANTSFATTDSETAQYDKLFPQYAELCAGSQYRDQVDGIGGINGHGVLFLKGACRDLSAEYPQIKVCDNGPGVGISTNSAFHSVLWTATESREFFFYGGITPDAAVTREAVDEAIKNAQKQEILKNVVMQEAIMKGLNDNKWKKAFGVDEDVEHYRYRASLGSDWGVALARNMYCVRIPMTNSMMEKAVAHLNEENRKAFHREKGYETGYNWDVALNNCMHTAYNTLASAGMWQDKQIKSNSLQVILSPLTDGNLSMAVPFDTFLRVAKAASKKTMIDPRAMLKDRVAMNSVQTEQWILQQPGTMLVTHPIHQYKNIFFSNGESPHSFVKDQISKALDLTPLPIIKTGQSEKALNSLMSNKANTDLAENLKFSLKRLEEGVAREQKAQANYGIYLDDFSGYQEWSQSFTQFLILETGKAKELLKKYQEL